MKRTLLLNLTGLLLSLLVFTRCSNPGDRHQHPHGIAYYKMNLMPIPFLFDELDSVQLPFSISAAIKDSAIIGHKIYIHGKGRDSVNISFVTLNGSMDYTRHITDNVSNNFFTLYLIYPPPGVIRNTYAFQFLKPGQ